MSILETISLDNDVFRAYAFWTAITIFKMLFMSVLTGRTRLKNKIFINHEDTVGRNVEIVVNDEDVERIRRAHRNDLENCFPFMIIGFLFVLTNPSSFIGVNCMRIGAISRIIHTIAFLNALQPWRFIGFLGCILVTVYMGIQVLMFF
ncbi:hypothetical protein ACKWTF_005596 [Chironomus riparius]